MYIYCNYLVDCEGYQYSYIFHCAITKMVVHFSQLFKPNNLYFMKLISSITPHVANRTRKCTSMVSTLYFKNPSEHLRSPECQGMLMKDM